MKTILTFSLALSLLVTNSHASVMGKIKTQIIVTDKTTTGTTSAIQPLCVTKTIQGIGNTTAGAGATTIEIQVSNDGTNYFVDDTLSITLATTVASDTYVSLYPYKYIRGNVATISGTGAKVSLIIGCQI